jgi:hypothetical protein
LNSSGVPVGEAEGRTDRQDYAVQPEEGAGQVGKIRGRESAKCKYTHTVITSIRPSFRMFVKGGKCDNCRIKRGRGYVK